MSKKEALAAFLAKVNASAIPDSVDGPVSFIARTKKWTVKLPSVSAAGGAGSAAAGAGAAAAPRVAEGPIRITAQLSHTVVVEDCAGPAELVIAGKPKTVLVDSSKDLVISIESCVCGVEIVNCSNVTIRCAQQQVPSISVDKTTGAHIMLLSDAALDSQVVWCDAKDLKLSYKSIAPADSEAAVDDGACSAVQRWPADLRSTAALRLAELMPAGLPSNTVRCEPFILPRVHLQLPCCWSALLTWTRGGRCDPSWKQLLTAAAGPSRRSPSSCSTTRTTSAKRGTAAGSNRGKQGRSLCS